jgi:hypothetical protein
MSQKERIFEALCGVSLVAAFPLCLIHSFQPSVLGSALPQWGALAAATVFFFISKSGGRES